MGSLEKILNSFADVSTKHFWCMKVLASKACEDAGIVRSKLEGLLVFRIYLRAKARTRKESAELDLAAVEISQQAMGVG